MHVSSLAGLSVLAVNMAAFVNVMEGLVMPLARAIEAGLPAILAFAIVLAG